MLFESFQMATMSTVVYIDWPTDTVNDRKVRIMRCSRDTKLMSYLRHQKMKIKSMILPINITTVVHQTIASLKNLVFLKPLFQWLNKQRMPMYRLFEPVIAYLGKALWPVFESLYSLKKFFIEVFLQALKRLRLHANKVIAKANMKKGKTKRLSRIDHIPCDRKHFTLRWFFSDWHEGVWHDTEVM